VTHSPRFPPQARIRSGAEFTACFAARQRLSGRYFLLHWRQAGAASARLGLAIAKRVEPTAVGRNRIKRQLREAFRLRCATLPALDLVVLARAEAARAATTALRADIDALFDRLLALPHPSLQGTMPAASEQPAAAVTSAPASPT
jgi:ribonuclease P protein component